MKTILTIILLLIFQLNSSSQELKPANPEMDSSWSTFGVGIGNKYNLSSVISANFGRKNILLFAVHSNFDLGDVNGISSISAGYGKSKVTDLSRLAFSLAPAFVFGGESGKLNSRFTTLGFISNLQLIFTPVKKIGLGLDLSYNLNFKHNITGLSLQ